MTQIGMILAFSATQRPRILFFERNCIQLIVQRNGYRFFREFSLFDLKPNFIFFAS